MFQGSFVFPQSMLNSSNTPMMALVINTLYQETKNHMILIILLVFNLMHIEQKGIRGPCGNHVHQGQTLCLKINKKRRYYFNAVRVLFKAKDLFVEIILLHQQFISGIISYIVQGVPQPQKKRVRTYVSNISKRILYGHVTMIY